MANPVVYHWKAADTQAICKTQNAAAGVPLFINGTEASQGTFAFIGVTRAVSLTSAANLSGVNFTIVGTLNNRTVTETRVGPNDNTVQFAGLFQKVISITASGVANGISVGSGHDGRTNWFTYNYQQTYGSLSAVISGISDGFNEGLYGTVDDVSVTDNPFVFSAFTEKEGIVDGVFALLDGPIIYASNYVTAYEGAFKLTFLQQGVT